MNEPELLFNLRTRRPISSSPLLVDANDDGWPEVFVGGARFYGLTWDGAVLPRWPQKARRPFASSAAFGDINGDGRGEVVIGCDDGGVYAYHVDGSLLNGWPFRTDRDVFSTPALADLDGDGSLEVIVGSDDGTLYALNGDGTAAWRTETPGNPFISASPTVVDLDGDGSPEIAVGAWDQVLHVWTSDGRPGSFAMPERGSIIWSSATAFQIEGAGTHLTWASDRAYLASGGGEMVAGWPNPTGSWAVSSPALVMFGPGEASIVMGSDRLYCWDLHGSVLPGWPVDLGEYVWGSPIAFDVDGDGYKEVVVGAWDGAVHAFRRDGNPVAGFPLHTEGPIFSSPAAASLSDGGGLLVIASWDGSIRGWRLPLAVFREDDWAQFRGSPLRSGVFPVSITKGKVSGSTHSTPSLSGNPEILGSRTEDWFGGVRRVIIEGTDLSFSKQLIVHYEIPGEQSLHHSPVMKSGTQFVALIQPLRTIRRLRYWIELERQDGTTQRWPSSGAESVYQLPQAVNGLLQRVREPSRKTVEGHSGR